MPATNPDYVKVDVSSTDVSREDAQLLTAWKEAVTIIGPEFFAVQSQSVETATNCHQLRPNLEAIRRHLRTCKDGTDHFYLFTVMSLYSYSMIVGIFKQAKEPLPVIGLSRGRHLPEEQLKSVIRLMDIHINGNQQWGNEWHSLRAV